jgi:hypothetical protein
MPTASDLVTDLPADFEVFGQAVDTSLADLKGGTTGQVLKKNSNTDMDFVWGADSAGMTNPMTTTGDTIYSSSGSTPARLGIGSTGQVLSVSSGLPAWTTISAGSLTSIATGSLSGSSVTISSINQTYKNLTLLLLNPRTTTTNKTIEMRFNADSTANSHVQSGTYGYQAGIAVSQSSVQIVQGMNNSTTYDNGIIKIDFWDYANTGIYKLAETVSMTENDAAGEVRLNNAKLGYYSTSAVTSIQVLVPTDSFAGGTYILYGVN